MVLLQCDSSYDDQVYFPEQNISHSRHIEMVFLRRELSYALQVSFCTKNFVYTGYTDVDLIQCATSSHTLIWTIACVNFSVSLQVHFLVIPFLTLFTLQNFPFIMSFYVFLKCCIFFCKTFPTLYTIIRFYSSVNSQMILKSTSLCKTFPTLGTLIWFISSVNIRMPDQWTFWSEGHLTLSTLILLLP